ncbi:MAG TPA: heparan-alpha-glucosaminide N-acetyltransferase domain-containing protein [Tepidisphaeraceae bacterium]|nr:heparan-alpha-glucosaminide N-acetyltransferase domain-containing protein [Tepidisphaeraceae bacterium]
MAIESNPTAQTHPLQYDRVDIAPTKPKRLMSLDAFRGATIVGMILVNNPGSWSHMYPPLAHAQWHGCTPTDWIFPFFLFIVGVAVPFSQAHRRNGGSLVTGVLRRSAILFGLGLFLGAIPYSGSTGIFNLADFRIPGVLQRIAVCYAVVALLSLWVGWKQMACIGLLLLAAYFGAMRLIPAPGFAAGDFSKEGNLAHFIDQTILGRHGYKAYNDPEGILSTLPAIVTVICGWLVGTWLRRADRTAAEKVAGVFSFGVLGVMSSWVLDSALMPINKQIWTPSYVIHTAGLACLGLGLFYWIIDIVGYQKWASPLIACGMNAITIFVLAGVVGRLMLIKAVPAATGERGAIKPWLYDTLFKPLFESPYNESLAWALVFVALFIALAMAMHRARIYIKV